MADPYDIDPIRPKPPSPPPLPRLWKNPPEPEAPVEVARSKGEKERGEGGSESNGSADKSKAKKKKKKKPEEQVDDGTGATKLEETPVLDTYEARQRARWIIGGVLSAIGLVFLVVVLRAFRGNGTEEIREGEMPDPREAIASKANAEQEARTILDYARQSDKLGKTKASLDLLNKVTKNYQNTAAAREAMHALDRSRHNRPLFGNDLPEQVGGPKAPAPGMATATGPAAPKDAGPSATAPSPPKPLENAPTAPVAVTPVAPPVIAKPLPSGYRAKHEFPVHPSGWPTRIVCEHDNAELMFVPTGTFLMGRDDGDPAERPAHQVAVSAYYIDRHEVTVRQYFQFLKETGRPIDAAKLVSKEAPDQTSTDEHPITNVSAREAKAYCLWAGRRLPTEAQWEMAARSPEGKISYWNGELPRKDPVKGSRPMEPVMTLPSDVSPFGAFDMAANAWEWTAEYYDSHYYQQFRNLVTDPTGPKESPAKIARVTVKGGSKSGILTWRDGQNIETRLPYLGFRGALPVEGLPAAPPAPAPTPAAGPNLPGNVVPF